MKKLLLLYILLISSSLILGICMGEDRANLPLRKALLGHWKDPQFGIHYYFDLTKYEIVKQRRRQEPTRYQILSVKENKLNIKTHQGKRRKEKYKSFYKELEFSPDRNSLNMRTDTWETITKLIYVDDQQRPKEPKGGWISWKMKSSIQRDSNKP